MRAASARGRRRAGASAMLDQVYMKLGHHRDGRHGGGHQGAVDAAVLRQGRASASTARRTAATARRCRSCKHPDVWTAASASSSVTVVAPLRLDLHRAVHVDSAGEQGRLRGRQRDELREEPQGPAAASTTAPPTTTCTRTTRCSSSARCSRRGRASRCRSGPTPATRGVNNQRMMEFFIENLVMRPERSLGR